MTKKSIRVLLVEDNPAEATLAEEILADEANMAVRPLDIRIETVTRLAAALDRLATEKFDLVILDLYLPDCRGIQTFQKLHEKYPAVPTIVLTGLDDDTIGPLVMQQGAQDYLDKGTDLGGDILSHAIISAIERHKFRVPGEPQQS